SHGSRLAAAFASRTYLARPSSAYLIRQSATLQGAPCVFFDLLASRQFFAPSPPRSTLNSAPRTGSHSSSISTGRKSRLRSSHPTADRSSSADGGSTR